MKCTLCVREFHVHEHAFTIPLHGVHFVRVVHFMRVGQIISGEQLAQVFSTARD